MSSGDLRTVVGEMGVDDAEFTFCWVGEMGEGCFSFSSPDFGSTSFTGEGVFPTGSAALTGGGGGVSFSHSALTMVPEVGG